MNDIEKIIIEINEEFNTNSAYYRYYSEEDSYFILINDKDLFESDKFQEYIFTRKNELWNEGIFNIHFDYEDQAVAVDNYGYAATPVWFSQAIDVSVSYSIRVPISGQLSVVAADNYDAAALNLFSQTIVSYSMRVPISGQLSAVVAADNYDAAALNLVSQAIEAPVSYSMRVPISGQLSAVVAADNYDYAEAA